MGTNQSWVNLTILKCAALLHDVGYSKRKASWYLDCFEHIEIGKQIARDILNNIPFFAENPTLISGVLSLIEHHDDTKYSFPSSINDGKPRLVKDF